MAKQPKRRSGSLISPASLSQTVDATNAVLFAGGTLSSGERKSVGDWIAARQGLPGAYAGTFAAFPRERTDGIVTFTGERITSASARHILGEESCRVLRTLTPRDRAASDALDRANRSLQTSIDRAHSDPRNDNPGLFCCGKCSVGFWRNLLSGGLDRQEERLQRGVAHLRRVRDNEGGWRKFPFWYTVLALSEMDVAGAREELEYVSPALTRAANRAAASSSVYSARRKTLSARALAKL
jgi:hypothetical protein